MKAVICDCCEKVIPVGKTFRVIEIKKADIDMVNNEADYKHELCTECSEMIRDYIMNYKNMPSGIGVD